MFIIHFAHNNKPNDFVKVIREITLFRKCIVGCFKVNKKWIHIK